MSLLKKIWENRWALRSIMSSIYFNFKVFPLRQALKLPVLLYKPHFRSLKGKFLINGKIKPGMIILGRNQVPLYPNNGITIENRGTIIFNGYSTIGNASAITIGSTGTLSIGEGVIANAAFKVASYCNIEIGNYSRFGWDCLLMDTDFHKLTLPSGDYSKGYAPIRIGDNCWLGTGCLVLKGTKLPSYTTVQARTTLSKDYDYIAQKCVIGESHPIIVKAKDTYRDMDNDHITYPI